jgi:hypothetical protein
VIHPSLTSALARADEPNVLVVFLLH